MTGTADVEIERVDGTEFTIAVDTVVLEEPMEIRIEYGPRKQRILRPIAVTMRTPGHDEELAAGFLWTEGVIGDTEGIDEIVTSHPEPIEPQPDTPSHASGSSVLPGYVTANLVIVRLYPDAEVRLTSLERNFYTTSSCGVCGKASLSALRVLGPPRTFDHFRMPATVLSSLPQKLRDTQPMFKATGGLHGAAIVTSDGQIELTREDVGRHNAVDKLVGHGITTDALPFRDRCLLLSGRASFELMQKSVMAGIPFVAAVGAPSSLAITVAREFGITLVGFLRDGSFNVYSGFHRIADRTYA